MPIPKNRLKDHIKVGLELYRYTSSSYSGFRVRIYEETWVVDRLTPQGAWIRQINDGYPNSLGRSMHPRERWIGLTTKFVWVTKQDALKSLYMRKHRQYRILEVQLDSTVDQAKAAKSKIVELFGAEAAQFLPDVGKNHVKTLEAYLYSHGD